MSATKTTRGWTSVRQFSFGPFPVVTAIDAPATEQIPFPSMEHFSKWAYHAGMTGEQALSLFERIVDEWRIDPEYVNGKSWSELDRMFSTVGSN